VIRSFPSSAIIALTFQRGQDASDLAELALNRPCRTVAPDTGSGRLTEDALAYAAERPLEFLAGPAHCRHVAALHRRLERGYPPLHIAAHVGRHALAQVAQALLRLIDQTVRRALNQVAYQLLELRPRQRRG
jgi:hypothetical protein